MLKHAQQFALPLDLHDPADPLEEALTHHRTDRFGFFSILKTISSIEKDGKTFPVREQHSHRLAELGEVLAKLPASTDVWISQSEFTRPNRRLVNLARITTCFVDLDYYKLRVTPGRSSEDVAGIVLRSLARAGIPAPSLIIDSGRGLQIKWLIDPIPANALPRWNAVQKVLVDSLKPLMADAQAKNASQVLRLVGTFNSRSGILVRVIYAETTRPYSFDALADAVLPVARKEIEARQNGRCIILPFDEGKRRESRLPSSHPSGLKQLSARELWWNRLADIRTIAKLRGWENGAPEGMQDLALWLSAIALTWSMPSAWLAGELEQLGREFAPSWTSEQHRAVLSTTLERKKAADMGEKIEWSGMQVDPRYRLKNDTLIDLLHITPEEEQQLSTIIGKSEARRRDAKRQRERRESAGAMPRATYEGRSLEREKMAVEMRRQGCPVDAIAGALGVSKRTVYNYLAT